MVSFAAAALLALQISAPPRPPDLSRGLLAYLPFDRDTVDVVTGARLPAPGTRQVAGVQGGALLFDGHGAHLSLGERLQPDRFTIAAWIRVDSVDRPQVVVSKQRHLPGHVQRNLELRLEPGGRIQLVVPSGRRWDGLLTQQVVQAGRWTHLAAVYDGQRASVFVDGARDPVFLEVRYAQSRSETMVGARPEGGGPDGRPSGPTAFLDGAVDELRVYDRALSEGELAALAAPPAPPAPAPRPEPSLPAAAQDDAADLSRMSLLVHRFDLACLRRDLVQLREVEAKVLEELEGELREARAERTRGPDQRLEVVRRAQQTFQRDRGRIETAALDAKRSALVELSESAWRQLAEDLEREGRGAPRWAERGDPGVPEREGREGREGPREGSPEGPARATIPPMTTDRFERLHAAMRREPFSAGRLRVLEGALPDAFLSVAQLERLLELFSFSSERLEVVRRVRPRLVDPELAGSLYRMFTFESEKEELTRLLAH